MTSFRIGYNPGSLLTSEQVLEFSKLADSISCVDSIWIPESWGRESFSTLGAISQITKRVRLGTSIISIYARSPATVGMAAMTLDYLSNNRTVIGLGASTPTLVSKWHGKKFDNPVLRMREYVQCINSIMTGEKVSFDGQYYSIDNFKILYKPQRDKIPVYMAAVNPKMMDLCTSIADGILLYLRPYEEIQQTVRKLRSARTRISKEDFEVACVFICAVSEKEPEKARERAARTLAFYISAGKYYSNFLSRNGFHNEVAEIIDSYSSEGAEVAARKITDKMLDSITISGSKEHCISLLNRFKNTGIDLPILQVNPVDKSEGSIREMLSTFQFD